MILYHGTGARRRQSIEERGLLPKPGSYVYASPQRLVAVVFAGARSELEDDWGLVVKFRSDRLWERDHKFPNSVRSRDRVPPENIEALEVVDLKDEYEAVSWLKVFVASISLEKEVCTSPMRSRMAWK